MVYIHLSVPFWQSQELPARSLHISNALVASNIVASTCFFTVILSKGAGLYTLHLSHFLFLCRWLRAVDYYYLAPHFHIISKFVTCQCHPYISGIRCHYPIGDLRDHTKPDSIEGVIDSSCSLLSPHYSSRVKIFMVHHHSVLNSILNLCK